MKRNLHEDEMAKQTNNHFLFNIFAFGGGVWGGVALKGKGNV